LPDALVWWQVLFS